MKCTTFNSVEYVLVWGWVFFFFFLSGNSLFKVFWWLYLEGLQKAINTERTGTGERIFCFQNDGPGVGGCGRGQCGWVTLLSRVFPSRSCVGAPSGHQVAALDSEWRVQVPGIKWWLWAFFCSPSSPLSFYFFIIPCSQELQIWTNCRFHPSLAVLICERVWFRPWCNVLRNCSEEREQNFFAGGCRMRGDTAFLLGSRRFFLIPNHIYLSFLYLLTVQNVIWKKKKISYNVAAKLLPGECACWEPGAIWKQ